MPNTDTKVTSHTLIVTHDEAGVSQYAIECPGLSEDCIAYVRCEEPSCQAAADDDEGPVSMHGVPHILVEDDPWWSVPTGECFMATYGHIADAASVFGHLPTGRYLVEPSDNGPTFDDPRTLELMFSEGETFKPHSACSPSCPVCDGGVAADV